MQLLPSRCQLECDFSYASVSLFTPTNTSLNRQTQRTGVVGGGGEGHPARARIQTDCNPALMLCLGWLCMVAAVFQDLNEPHCCEHCWRYALGLYYYFLVLRILQRGMSLTKGWKIKVRWLVIRPKVVQFANRSCAALTSMPSENVFGQCGCSRKTNELVLTIRCGIARKQPLRINNNCCIIAIFDWQAKLENCKKSLRKVMCFRLIWKYVELV